MTIDARKIAVVGISGSGKSFLARRLGQKLSLPVVHMDKFFWRGNWEAVSEPDYLIQHAELINEEKWIIEGYVDKKMANRLEAADLILYLDYSGFLCTWRVFVRWLQHRRESRPELAREAKEVLNFHFLWMVLTRGERKDIEDALQSVDHVKVLRFHSSRELNHFIHNETK